MYSVVYVMSMSDMRTSRLTGARPAAGLAYEPVVGLILFSVHTVQFVFITKFVLKLAHESP